MNFNFLSPVSNNVLAFNELLPAHALGKKIAIHSQQNGIPNMDNVQLAIIGVPENRNDVNYLTQEISLQGIRKDLYGLFPGNWQSKITDLGNINKGETVEDTYFALRTTLSILIQKNIIPIILGGSQDLTYANYRAYDTFAPMVNIINIDSKFDLGNSSKPISNKNFVGKIILDKPYNLFNYTTLGYQTYFNSSEEIDLMNSMYFESYRLGKIKSDITLTEPLMRDSNIVTIDVNAIQIADTQIKNGYPNGLSGLEICTISRYAGISNKVSSFGVYEFNSGTANKTTTTLIAQMLWYFIEGYNYRVEDDNFEDENNFQKFTVLVEEEPLVFYKSTKTNRWWIEIPFFNNTNNKLKKYTLLPCMHKDYKDACNDNLPERWYKAQQKNLL